jgi:hypothetical protein
MSYSSTIAIEEIDANGSTVMRSVMLVGPSLPLMETEWSAKNQLATTWYPGNSAEATQQNLGPRLLPSTWKGDWRRTMMGGTPAQYWDGNGTYQPIVDPSVLRDALEGIFTAGRRLRVTWATQQQPDGSAAGQYAIAGSIVREGRADTWKFTHRTIHDITWEITFDWVSRGGAVTPRVVSTRDDTLVKTAAPYAAAIQGLITASRAAQVQQLAPSALTLGNLEGVAPAPLAAMTTLSVTTVQLQNDLVSIAGIGANLAAQPIQVAQMALAHAANALAVTQTQYQEFSAIPAEVMTSQDDAISVLSAYALFGAVQDQAQQAEIAAYTFYRQMRRAVPTHTSALNGLNSVAQTPAPDTILAYYTTRDRDTAQRISMTFYGTPDHAADILRANRLPWYQAMFSSGKQLVIPVISSSTATV